MKPALVLDKDMTVADELYAYLKNVLEINDEKIPDIIGLFNDYTAKVEMG